MALLALVVGSDYAGLAIALALTHGSPEVQAMVALRLRPGLHPPAGHSCASRWGCWSPRPTRRGFGAC